MSITKLIGPVASYIGAANAQDIEAVAASFNEDAVVRDEGQDKVGKAAIREWALEVSNKYHPTVEVLDVAETDGRTVLTGRVSGDFPGSPVDLHYAFRLGRGRIERLEIT